MLITKPYTNKIKLVNKSHSEAKTRISLKGKTSEGLDVKLTSPKLTQDKAAYTGILTEIEEELEVTITSKIIGNHRAYFVGEVEDGNPFTFEVFGHFTGSRVKIAEKTVDFGLVRTKSTYEFKVNLENTTEVEAEVLVKNVKNKALTFDTLNYESLIPGLDKKPGSLSKHSSADGKGFEIKIEPEYKKLGPLEKAMVMVTLKTSNPETIEEFLEIGTKLHSPQYLSLHAEVQKPHLSLSRSKVDLGITYAGLQYRVDSKHKCALYIKNYGNLDAQFQVIYFHIFSSKTIFHSGKI